MVRVFIAIALIAGASAAGAGEPPAEAGVAMVQACLEENRAAGVNRHGLCLDLIAGPCRARPGGETTLGMVECANRELAVWDSLLNRYYRDLIRQLDSTARTALRDAQRAWIAFCDKTCAFGPAVYEGGSIGGPIRAQCLMQETARRATDLKGWLEEMDR